MPLGSVALSSTEYYDNSLQAIYQKNRLEFRKIDEANSS